MACIPKFRRKPDQQTGDLQSILFIPSGQDYFLNPIPYFGNTDLLEFFFNRMSPFSPSLHRRNIYEILGGITIPSQELVGVVQWHAGEHLQGWVSLLAVGFSVTSEQSDHVTVWGQNALLCPKTVVFTLMHGKIKKCCNKHFTKSSEWCYLVLGWVLLMILLGREWKEINLQKLSITQVSYIFNHCYLFQAQISKEKRAGVFHPIRWCWYNLGFLSDVKQMDFSDTGICRRQEVENKTTKAGGVTI